MIRQLDDILDGTQGALHEERFPDERELVPVPVPAKLRRPAWLELEDEQNRYYR